MASDCVTSAITILGTSVSVPGSRWGDSDEIETYSVSPNMQLAIQCTDTVRIVVNSTNAICYIGN
jgi:hypothetical protein